MTRLFRGGRTETIRSLSETSCNFVKTFEDPTASEEERWAALQLAVTNHVVSAKDAMTGKGVDRHLFALYVVASGMDVDSEFLKDAISQPWILSTSQQPQRQVTKGWNPDDPAIEYRCGSVPRRLPATLPRLVHCILLRWLKVSPAGRQSPRIDVALSRAWASTGSRVEVALGPLPTTGTGCRTWSLGTKTCSSTSHPRRTQGPHRPSGSPRQCPGRWKT